MNNPKQARRPWSSEAFSLLPKSENPKVASFGDVPCVLHEDHRWILPIVFAAQQNGLLPRPCTLVMFDLHHDCVAPNCDGNLQNLTKQLNLPGVVELCSTHLRTLDDDWLRAGMEIGVFGDAVIFGTEHHRGRRGQCSANYDLPYDLPSDANGGTHTDQSGNTHRIKIVSLPSSSLAYQGSLSDIAKRGILEPLWNILGWKVDGERFEFDAQTPKIILSIDLDCFTVQWSNYNFPWPDEVFQSEFLERSTYRTTEGWSGGSFLRGLATKSGLITVARETECTDGVGKAESIWENLNRYGFGSQIRFDSFT